MASKSTAPGPFRVIWTALVDWWDGWLDIVLMILVWFFAQITIVLGPPATFGVYYVIYRMQNGEALGLRGMIEGARMYFGKALLWGLANLLVIITLFVNVQFYSNIATMWGFYLLIFVLMLGAFWFATQFYALPFFMEQDIKKLRVAWKNGLLTTLAAPLFTLIMMIVVVLILALSVGLIIPLFLGLPGIVPMLGFRAMYNRLVKFGIRQPEKTPREIEYEMSGKIDVPVLDRILREDAGSGAPPDGVADGKGQVKQEE